MHTDRRQPWDRTDGLDKEVGAIEGNLFGFSPPLRIRDAHEEEQ
jgi:hypothetical protein